MIELDRFSTADLARWGELSKDLDELVSLMYAGLEPKRQRYQKELVDALRVPTFASVDFGSWVRIVPWRYADVPLSTAGSLKLYGGRFNVGAGIEYALRSPWPALYLGSDHETAYREKFGLAKGDTRSGLTGDELALQPGNSYSAVLMRGRLSAVFDLTQPNALDAICKVLCKITMPPDAVKLRRRLKIDRNQAKMVRTPHELFTAIMTDHWQVAPAQFWVPSTSQVFAGLVLDAGYEAICYPSTKGQGMCIAVFPHRLVDASFVEVMDDTPPSVTHARLDTRTAGDLCGWETLPRIARPD